MLDVAETLAVREAVALQPPRRRRVCELLMAGCTRWEVQRKLGLSRPQLYRRMHAIRESFVELGFGDWARPRRAKKILRPEVLCWRRPTAILGVRWRKI